MAMTYTPDQEKAIYTPISKTIVSAGAGSGKTAVLTERVIQHLLNGHHMDDFLVVTFTKAAALEMKERIRKRLSALKQTHPELNDELERLDIAHISTFDSFSLFIVQKYAHVLGLDPNVSIADEVTLRSLKESLIDTYFESLHQKKDEGFLTLLKTYSTKSPRKIKSMVLSLADQLIKSGDMKLSKTAIETTFSPAFFNALEADYTAVLKEKIQFLDTFIGAMEGVTELGPKTDHVNAIKDALAPLKNARSSEEIKAACEALKLPSKKAKVFTDEDAVFDRLLDDLKSIIASLKKLTRAEFHAFQDEIILTQPFVKTLLAVAQGFNASYMQSQKATGLFDFQTMAYMALELVRNHDDVREDLKQRFTEILIDEYQDTSPLQDQLMDLITDDNVYIVGDIKQSIYRFRDASPALFKQKFEQFPLTGGVKIELAKNFRSRQSVIEAINAIFTPIFDDTLGGIDYTDGQALVFGLESYTHSEKKKSFGLERLAYDHERLKELKELHAYSHLDDQAMYVESIMMARWIKNAIQTLHPTYDKETGTLRSMRYDDCVILVDRKSRFDVIQDAFNAENVPLHAHKEEHFISHPDVYVLINLFKLYLSLVDDSQTKTHFKHAFLSVAYSYVLDVSQDDIVAFILSLDTLTPEAIFKASEKTPFESFFAGFKAMKKTYHSTPLSQIIDRFNEAFNVVEKALGLGAIKEVEERYLFIASRLQEFEDRQASLHDWVDYLHYTLENNDPNNAFFSLDIDYVKGTQLMEGTVNVMSIHKSKGLEFPFVFYPQTQARLRMGDTQSITYDAQYGIIMDVFDEGLKEPLTSMLLKERSSLDDLSEKLRVWYVALTRAREKMIVISPVKPADLPGELFSDEKKVPDAFRRLLKSYKGLMDLVSPYVSGPQTRIPLDESFFQRGEVDADNPYRLEPGDAIMYKTYTGTATVITQETYSMDRIDWMQASTVQAIEKGNRMHDLLEHIDFKGDLTGVIQNVTEDLDLQAMLQTFFNHPFTKELLSQNVYKELPFLEETDEGIKRGVIDLIFEDNDSFTVVDYKLRATDKDGYIDQVKGYVKYVEKRTKKTGSGYLYSLIDGTFKRVV